MSGIGAVIASGGGVVANPPLAASLVWNGDVPFYQASGASGICSSYTVGGTFYPNIINLTISGGTPPYTGTYHLSGDPSGKIGVGSDSSGVYTTLNWSGFSLNEIESVQISATVTDSVGGSVTATLVGSIPIKRTS